MNSPMYVMVIYGLDCLSALFLIIQGLYWFFSSFVHGYFSWWEFSYGLFETLIGLFVFTFLVFKAFSGLVEKHVNLLNTWTGLCLLFVFFSVPWIGQGGWITATSIFILVGGAVSLFMAVFASEPVPDDPLIPNSRANRGANEQQHGNSPRRGGGEANEDRDNRAAPVYVDA